MRRGVISVLVVVVAATIVAATTAGATSCTLRFCGFPTLQPVFGGSVSPRTLPRSEYAPIVASIFGKIGTSDETHPSALREVVLDVDKDVKIGVKGYPVCKDGRRETLNANAARRVCGDAILGSGVAHIEVAFPERKPILVTSPITVFNGGESGGKVKLLIHAFITVPRPASIVTVATIARKGTEVHSIAKIPVIDGGSGSVVDFSFKLGKTYSYKGERVGVLEARCPDDVFKVTMPKVLLRNEAKIPSVAPTTVVKGSFAVPCRPTGY